MIIRASQMRQRRGDGLDQRGTGKAQLNSVASYSVKELNGLPALPAGALESIMCSFEKNEGIGTLCYI